MRYDIDFGALLWGRTPCLLAVMWCTGRPTPFRRIISKKCEQKYFIRPLANDVKFDIGITLHDTD